MRSATPDLQHHLRHLHTGLRIEVNRRRPCKHLLPRVMKDVPHSVDAVWQEAVVAPKSNNVSWLHLIESELEVVEHADDSAGRHVADSRILACCLLDHGPRVVNAPIVRDDDLEILILL